jgi:hypothetical protein
MNKHNDFLTVRQARQEPKRRKSDYQYLIAKKALNLGLTLEEKRESLRLRAFGLVGRCDEKAR